MVETNDGLPFIGETSSKQFAATGYAGNGMTFGTLAGMMAHDCAVGRRNPWRELFDPGRTKVRGGTWDYIKENMDYPYYMLRDRFAGTDAKSLRAVPRGEGRIVELAGKKVAAYRTKRAPRRCCRRSVPTPAGRSPEPRKALLAPAPGHTPAAAGKYRCGAGGGPAGARAQPARHGMICIQCAPPSTI